MEEIDEIDHGGREIGIGDDTGTLRLHLTRRDRHTVIEVGQQVRVSGVAERSDDRAPAPRPSS